MDCLFEIASDFRLLRATFRGVMDDDALLDCHAKARRIATSTGAQAGIADFSGVESFQVTANLLRVLAAGPALFPAPLRSLIVSPADHIYGMARMFEILAEGTQRNIRVVRTLDQAYRLLGIETQPVFKRVEPEDNTTL